MNQLAGLSLCHKLYITTRPERINQGIEWRSGQADQQDTQQEGRYHVKMADQIYYHSGPNRGQVTIAIFAVLCKFTPANALLVVALLLTRGFDKENSAAVLYVADQRHAC